MNITNQTNVYIKAQKSQRGGGEKLVEEEKGLREGREIERKETEKGRKPQKTDKHIKQMSKRHKIIASKRKRRERNKE